MFFAKEFIILPNTPRSEPYSTSLELTTGIIKDIWIQWRYGASYICGCRLGVHSFFYWPLSLKEWILATSDLLHIGENFALDSEPFTLDIQAFNEDDTYEHRLWLAVNVQREGEEIVDASYLLGFLGVEYYG